MLASGSSDATILIWDTRLDRLVLPTKTPARLDADELARCWAALAGADPKPAYQAMARMLVQPEISLPFLREHLQPVPALPVERIPTLIADLKADQFEVRERAFGALQKLGHMAEPQLRQALTKKPSLDFQRQLERLIDELSNEELGVPAGAWLRTLRAIRLLEALGTPEPRQQLDRLAKGAANANTTQFAKAALQRLARNAAP